jgi:hypothetical protein
MAAASSVAFRLLPGRLAVVRLDSAAQPPHWALEAPFFSLTRTPAELSVVCPEDRVPPDVRQERGWRCLEALGPFDLSQTGIADSFVAPLARGGVAIFLFSTFDTDYLMVRQRDLEKAVAILRDVGHRIDEESV